MSKLMLRDHIFEPLLDVRRDFDHALHHLFRYHAVPGLSTEVLAMVPPIETWLDEADKQFHLTMPLPGLTPEQVSVHVQGNSLVLSGEQETETKDSAKMFFEREITTHSFRRVIPLPDGSDTGKLTATLSDGILEIVVPIDPSALPKKIVVQSKAKTAETAAKAAQTTTKALQTTK